MIVYSRVNYTANISALCNTHCKYLNTQYGSMAVSCLPFTFLLLLLLSFTVIYKDLETNGKYDTDFSCNMLMNICCAAIWYVGIMLNVNILYQWRLQLCHDKNTVFCCIVTIKWLKIFAVYHLESQICVSTYVNSNVQMLSVLPMCIIQIIITSLLPHGQ